MNRTQEIKKRTIGLVGEDTVNLSVSDYNYLISRSESYDNIIDQCLAESFGEREHVGHRGIDLNPPTGKQPLVDGKVKTDIKVNVPASVSRKDSGSHNYETLINMVNYRIVSPKNKKELMQIIREHQELTEMREVFKGKQGSQVNHKELNNRLASALGLNYDLYKEVYSLINEHDKMKSELESLARYADEWFTSKTIHNIKLDPALNTESFNKVAAKLKELAMPNFMKNREGYAKSVAESNPVFTFGKDPGDEDKVHIGLRASTDKTAEGSGNKQ